MADVIQVTLCWSLQPRQVHEQTLSLPEGSTLEAVVDVLKRDYGVSVVKKPRGTSSKRKP